MSWDLCHSPRRPHQQLFRLRFQKFFSRPLLRLLLFWAFFSAFLMLLCQTREQGGLLEVISSCSSPSHNLQTEHEDHKGGDKPLFSSTRMHRSDDDLLSFFLPPVSFLDLSGALRLKAALRASGEHTQRQRYSRPMADVSKLLLLSAVSLTAPLHKEAIKIGRNQRLFAA